MNECNFVESTEYGEYCTLYDKACNKNECEVMKRYEKSDDGRKDALSKLDEVMKEIGGGI